MKYKLMAVDIDDTLLNRQKEITPKTRDAILKAQEKGVKFVVSSGRLPYGVRPYAVELNILENGGFYMGFNGGAILNSDEEEIAKTYLDSKYIKPVYDEIKPYNVTTMVHRGSTIYADRKVNNYTEIESKVIGLPLNLVDDIAEFVDFPVHKLLVAGEP
ncbi:MAG: HAD hydrolase family protein, partial [Ruminococcus sp.]